MATKDTPHLNEWVKTFKSVASFAGKIGADTLKSMTPNISTSASSAVEAMRDSREIFNKAKSQVSSMKKDLKEVRRVEMPGVLLIVLIMILKMVVSHLIS